MAITRTLREIRIRLNEDGSAARVVRLAFTEQPDPDDLNPDIEIPPMAGAFSIDPTSLPTGAQTTLQNIINNVTNRLNADRPLNTG